jgi:DNA-binding response OmpR family regulator
VKETPNLIILDVNYPKNLIIQLIRALRDETVTPIFLVTKNMTDDDLLEVYHAGVDDCLVKPFSPSIYLAKIRVWLRHSPNINAESLEPLKAGNILLLPSDRTITVGKNYPIHLTNLETRLLYSLMSRPGCTVPIEELVQRVWGDVAIGDSTMVKNLVYRLRQKIEADPVRPVIIQTVPGQGYIFAH